MVCGTAAKPPCSSSVCRLAGMKDTALVACGSVAGLVSIPLAYGSYGKAAVIGGLAVAAYVWLKPPAAVVSEADLPADRRNLTTDRYTPDKVPEGLDAIIIGSGMSGLSCAAILARMGKKVLVLEQHDRTGGGSHNFELGKEGYSFDAGLHYVVPECGLLLQLCTGGETYPVDMDLMGEPPEKNGMLSHVRPVLCLSSAFLVEMLSRRMLI